MGGGGGGRGGERAKREQGGGTRAGDLQAGIDHTAHDVPGTGVRVEQGRGRAAHAVLQGVPAAVLLPDDGRDGGGGVAGGHGDGDAGRQRGPEGGVDHAGGHGQRVALRDSRGRPHGGRRYRNRDHKVGARHASPGVNDGAERTHSHPSEGVRSPGARPIDHGDRGYGEENRRKRGRPDSAAHVPEYHDGTALPARGQKVAGTV